MRVSPALLAALIAFPFAAGAAEPPPGAMRIVDAVYGDLASRQLCDATANIAAICDGLNPCKFLVSNALCGDPARNTPKRLFLAFKCGILPTQTLNAPETATVIIECPKDAAPGKST